MKRSRRTSNCSSTSTPKLTDLVKELLNKVSAEWELIGTLLKLEEGVLNAIKTDHRECRKCFYEMLKFWLRQDDPHPTWTAIIDALAVLQYDSLADELRGKYCNDDEHE